MIEKLKFFAYLRVATIQQSLSTQKRWIANYIIDNPEIEIIKWYYERGSGMIIGETLAQMKKDAIELKMDGIIVNSITRISRDIVKTFDFYHYLIDNNLKFISLKEPKINISNNNGDSNLIHNSFNIGYNLADLVNLDILENRKKE